MKVDYCFDIIKGIRPDFLCLTTREILGDLPTGFKRFKITIDLPDNFVIGEYEELKVEQETTDDS